MKKTLAIIVSTIMTLSLLAGVFTVTALADTVMPTSYELQTSESTSMGSGDIYLTEVPFTITGDDTLVTLDGPWKLRCAEVETIPLGVGSFMSSAKPAGE